MDSSLCSKFQQHRVVLTLGLALKQQCGVFRRVVAACVRSWENVYRLGCASNMALTQLSHCGPRGKDLRSTVTPFWLTTIIFAQMTIKSIYKADSEAILSLELPGNQELGQGSGQVGGSLGRPSIAFVRSYLQVLALRMGILTDECRTAKLRVFLTSYRIVNLQRSV